MEARGDWSTFIGSDDGVQTANLVRYLDALASSETGLVTGASAHYTWPSASPDGVGRLTWWHTRRRDDALLIRTTDEARRFYDRTLFRARRFPRQTPSLPLVYMFGSIRRDRQERLRERGSGRLFRTVTPDWYLALAAVAHLESYEVCSVPIGIQGVSSESNGLKSSTKWREWIESELGRPALVGTGTEALGNLIAPSYTLLWLDIWATLRGVKAICDSDQRARLTSVVALSTSREKSTSVAKYLIDLWPEDAERIQGIFNLYDRLRIARVRDFIASAIRIGAPLLSGSVHVAVEGPSVNTISKASAAIPRVERLLNSRSGGMPTRGYSLEEPEGNHELVIGIKESPIKLRGGR